MLRGVGSGDVPGEACLPLSSCKRRLSQGQLAHVSTISIMFSGLMALKQCPMGGLRGHSLSLSYPSPLLASGSQRDCPITVKFPCHRVRLTGSCPSSLDYRPSNHLPHFAIEVLCHLLPQHFLHINTRPLRRGLAVLLAILFPTPGAVPVTRQTARKYPLKGWSSE